MAGQNKLPVPTESVEMQCLFRWAAYEKGALPELAMLYHIPNEGKRSRATGGRMVAEGLKSGVPDICLPVARGNFHGLYIELKRQKGGRVSENQEEWLYQLAKQGYFTAICRGWQEASEVIEAYLRGEKA
jgi:hypothetical protein